MKFQTIDLNTMDNISEAILNFDIFYTNYINRKFIPIERIHNAIYSRDNFDSHNKVNIVFNPAKILYYEKIEHFSEMKFNNQEMGILDIGQETKITDYDAFVPFVQTNSFFDSWMFKISKFKFFKSNGGKIVSGLYSLMDDKLLWGLYNSEKDINNPLHYKVKEDGSKLSLFLKPYIRITHDGRDFIYLFATHGNDLNSFEQYLRAFMGN